MDMDSNVAKQFEHRKDIMIGLAGTIQGNTIIVENDSIADDDGKDPILTILDHLNKKTEK